MKKLICLNCKEPVEAAKAKFFAEVYLCPKCYAIAEHFYGRLCQQLQQLIVVAKEAVRVALIEGRLHFNSPEKGGVSKKQLLETILEIEDKREQQCKEQIPTAQSGSSLPQNVRVLGAMARSRSPKVNRP